MNTPGLDATTEDRSSPDRVLAATGGPAGKMSTTTHAPAGARPRR
ncbi:hypothetical protein [Streptomyces sp. NPDC053720]